MHLLSQQVPRAPKEAAKVAVEREGEGGSGGRRKKERERGKEREGKREEKVPSIVAVISLHCQLPGLRHN